MGSFSIGGPSEKQKKAGNKRKEEEQEEFDKCLKKAKEKAKANREQTKEWFQGNNNDVPKIKTSEIDTSDLMKFMSIDIKA